MQEFKFVLKSLLIASAIVVFAQTKINGVTIEDKASIYLQQSSLSENLRQAAIGGAELLKTGYEKSIMITKSYWEKYVQK